MDVHSNSNLQRCGSRRFSSLANFLPFVRQEDLSTDCASQRECKYVKLVRVEADFSLTRSGEEREHRMLTVKRL